MTTLQKRVIRRGTRVAQSAGHRLLVVALEPGDLIAIRPEHCKRWERIPLEAVYVAAIKAGLRAKLNEKKGRKANRLLLRILTKGTK
jgi:hypothetical protein